MKKIFTFLLIINSLGTISFAQTWLTMSSGLGSSVESVKTIVENPISHEIFAGGTFTSPVSYLAKWNEGTATWEAVSGGVNGPVYSIVFKSNQMFVGGAFTMAGTTPVSNVAMLDNNAWSDIGGGFNGSVNCLYLSTDSTLYAGGSFSLSGSNTMLHISKLVLPSTWTQMGAGISSVVNAIAEFNGAQYAGCSNISAPLLKFNGSDWNAETDVFGGRVYALATFSNNLYAGGDFTSPTFAAARNNGSSWGTIQTTFSTSDKIYAFHSRLNTLLYIGGNFQNRGIPGHEASYIAKITSPTTPIQSITDQSSIVSSEVYAIGVQSGKVVAGGKFTSPASNITITSTTINVNEISDNVISRNLFPNPVNGKVHIDINTKENLKNPEIKIYTIQSQLVPNLNIESTNENKQTEFVVDCGFLPAGNYYYVVTDQNKNIATDNFVIQ
jgi:hypothetical protein